MNPHVFKLLLWGAVLSSILWVGMVAGQNYNERLNWINQCIADNAKDGLLPNNGLSAKDYCAVLWSVERADGNL